MAYFDSILPKTTGTEILSMANESANASARDARSARIAELENELAEIRKQRASLDTEADMGKYKFQYEADPSTYTTLMQNRRTAAQTEKIRKATEDATKQTSAQNMWNNLADKKEVATWALRDAERAFDEAERNQNVAGMRDAKDAIERYKKSIKTTDAKLEKLRNQFMKDLGVFDNEESQLDPKEMKGYEDRIAGNLDLESLNPEIVKLDNLLNMDRQRNYSQPEIDDVVDKANHISILRDRVANSNLSETTKAKLYEKLNELDVKANEWRGLGKRKPPKRLTPEEKEANARKAVFNADGKVKNPAQLAKLGAKTLRAYQQKYGWDLKAGIDRADREGNK